MLSIEQRGELRYHIEREIRELEERLAAAGRDVESVSPDLAIGRLSRLDALVNKGTKDMALAAQHRRLGLLREALASSVCVPCLDRRK